MADYTEEQMRTRVRAADPDAVWNALRYLAGFLSADRETAAHLVASNEERLRNQKGWAPGEEQGTRLVIEMLQYTEARRRALLAELAEREDGTSEGTAGAPS